MPFRNEYVPPLEEESSEFFRATRAVLRTGYSKYDRWTVNREGEMALVHMGSGHEIESASSSTWGFVDRRGRYVFSTEQLLRTEMSPEVVRCSYKLKGFWKGEKYLQPDSETVGQIKEALREYCRWHLFNPQAFGHCELTLVDGASGREI